MAATIAVLSQKAAPARRRRCARLTDVFRRLGLEVLAVDLDPQGNLSDYSMSTPRSTPPSATS